MTSAIDASAQQGPERDFFGDHIKIVRVGFGTPAPNPAQEPDYGPEPEPDYDREPDPPDLAIVSPDEFTYWQC